MGVADNPVALKEFLTKAIDVSKEHPIVVSKFIVGAKEIEFDAVAKEGEVICYAISEHVENAGVHSGDATVVLPAQKIYVETARLVKKTSKKIAKELKITGPFNIQFLAKDNEIKVIECNLRASRSFPFVSKVFKQNFIDIATKSIMNEKFDHPEKSSFDLDYVGVKAPQFSFSRLKGADPTSFVEMASTGEVGCIGNNFHDALLKAMLAVGYKIPKKTILLSTGPLESKADFIEAAKELERKGYIFYATKGTCDFMKKNEINMHTLYWPSDNKEPSVLTFLKERKIDLVINIPKNYNEEELSNDYQIRRCAVDFSIPLITNIQLAKQFAKSICALKIDDLEIKSYDEY
jgi:carbamoyl-phosphate synthase large subunit